MKKWWMLLLCVGLLTGCSAEPTFETVADSYAEPVSAPASQILLDLPGNAQAPVLQSDEAGMIYFCDEITVSVQTLAAGDLERTLQSVTGYGAEALQLVESRVPEGKCYACVWTSAGEGELLVGRTRIIDDGSYHYAVSVTVPESRAGQLQEQVQSVFASMRVADITLNTGS